ncbi:DUF4282 domain-containing protein [Brevibacterium sp. UMB1308A]|uniref:DUF4282 domain-containing protein n=1 Tax=Brevibacterium sp. UMB1308A TaxID=3050608 RepID=UPI002551A1AE|nr:DUF4282 domain-containing protein [Brevibacterium sp. UMB1308A]MDK8346491.1 DUF4282 domain-containing protein [Brevibacterium sp. UMB1308B]MDK8713654.1 DUF4282 domain-containing protein [Brevibacterium sp. UMB1308A]
MTDNYPSSGAPNSPTPPSNAPSAYGSSPYGSAPQATPGHVPQGSTQTGPVVPQQQYASAPVQPTAGQPAASQPAAGQPYPAANYNTGEVSQPTGQFQAQAPRGNVFTRFFKALFDLKFENFVTINFASVLYTLSIVTAVGTWLLWIVITAIASAAASGLSYALSGSGGGLLGMMFLPTIFLGWIPALAQIILSRIALEFMVANIRTAQNTTEMRRALTD